ncbi:hypothetical protein ACGRHY_30125 [Streptomyces sp. HK10]|uniref:hypothetical protein n=1 Tax=Streptomyces sp. HK10 TaxID=3373255 RepID=UPI0037479887
MSTTDYETLARDLISRTEAAVHDIATLAVDTGVTFQIEDIVQKVEDGLPASYPAPTTGGVTRRDVIADMARDILSGAMYAN